MADLCLDARNSVALQQRMLELVASEHGLSLRALSTLTGIGYSTLKGWRDGAAMPAWAIGKLGRAGVPDDLLSLILDPFQRHVGTNEEGDADFDDAARASLDLVSEVSSARHPASPGGVAIVHTEAALIRVKARRVCSAARAIAA